MRVTLSPSHPRSWWMPRLWPIFHFSMSVFEILFMFKHVLISTNSGGFNLCSLRLRDSRIWLPCCRSDSELHVCHKNRFYFVTSCHLFMHSPMISLSRFLWGEFFLRGLSISKIACSSSFIRERISGGVLSARFTSRVWLMTTVRVAVCRLQGQIMFSYKSPLSSFQYTALVADLLV